MLQGQQIDGVNCDACGKKVKFLKRSVFGKLPPHLIIALKRFALDFTTFEAVKINDRLEFPMELDMKVPIFACIHVVYPLLTICYATYLEIVV